jgi:hypothetical protein
MTRPRSARVRKRWSVPQFTGTSERSQMLVKMMASGGHLHRLAEKIHIVHVTLRARTSMEVG